MIISIYSMIHRILIFVVCTSANEFNRSLKSWIIEMRRPNKNYKFTAILYASDTILLITFSYCSQYTGSRNINSEHIIQMIQKLVLLHFRSTLMCRQNQNQNEMDFSIAFPMARTIPFTNKNQTKQFIIFFRRFGGLMRRLCIDIRHSHWLGINSTHSYQLLVKLS